MEWKSLKELSRMEKKDGLFTWWYENGKKEYEGTYRDGIKISVEEWNEDGSVKE